MAKKMAHSDAAADKKEFAGMLKKAMPKKIATHLKKDIGDSKKSIREDKGLVKGMKAKRGR